MARGAVGFETRPDRPALATLALFAGVVVVAALAADAFKEAVFAVIEWYGTTPDAPDAARTLARPVVALIAAAAVVASCALGRVAQRRFRGRCGLEAVAASARGAAFPISLRATMLRAAGTWLVAAALVPIGRESAIVESGGALGSAGGRAGRGRGDALAAAGMASAFAAAYHAPIASFLYVQLHLDVRSSPRATMFTAGGALGGHVVAVALLGGRPLLPGREGSLLALVVPAVVLTLPAVPASRAFLASRDRWAGAAFVSSRVRWRWPLVVVLALVAGVTVAVAPLTAGNGMEALRLTAGDATLTLALSLAVGKLVGAIAALAAGVPGGVLTPTMAVAAGWTLLAILAADGVDVVVEHPWDVVLVAMAVGVAVGMRSPLVAVALIPEMTGDVALVPVVGIAVLGATWLDRGIDALVTRRGDPLPTGVHDEDA